MPAAKVRSARVSVTRVDPEVWVSPDPGEVVERATGDERRKALYVDEMGRPLPVGLGRDGEPVHVDLDFFDGRKGGHMSVSGISGVATKTSFALFFLRMLTAREHAGIVGEGAANLRVLVFNVKGEDLLWLDTPNRLLRRAGARGMGRARGGAVAVPERQVLGAAQAPLRRRRAPRHRRPSRGGRGLHLDPAGVHRRGTPPLPPHRRQRPTQPDPVRARTRAGPIEALRGRRHGSAGRRGAARPLVPAARARRDGAGGAGRARDRRPRLARGRRRRLPRAGGRLRAGVRLERAGDGRHPVRLHAAAARRLRRGWVTWCRRDRRAASTAAPPASRWWPSSRCTIRRSGSSSARC